MEWIHQPATKTLENLMAYLFGSTFTIPLWIAMPLMLLCTIAFMAIAALILVWLERKIAARIQMRVGPMMTGFKSWAQYSMWLGGLMQTPADAIKLLQKELIFPTYIDKVPFILAPMVVVAACITALAVIPFGPGLSVTDINVGLIHIVAISSLAILSIIMAGWSSNNKYSLLGGLRSAAQMLSYEIPLIFALLGPILLSGTLSMQGMVEAQSKFSLWYGVPSFLGLVVYFIASIAEVNRPPFDIPEAEQELVSGFNTEYSGIMFSMFFLAEFANMFLVCAVAATVFLGGWAVPFWPTPDQINGWYVLAAVLSFAVKTGFLIFMMMWVRWTYPRVRPDHHMNFGWKYLFPLSLVNLAICAVVAVLHAEVLTDPVWGVAGIAAFSVIMALVVLLALQSISRPKPHKGAATH